MGPLHLAAALLLAIGGGVLLTPHAFHATNGIVLANAKNAPAFNLTRDIPAEYPRQVFGSRLSFFRRIRRKLDPQFLGLFDKAKILLGQRQHGNIAQVDFLRAPKRQQQVQWPFEPIDVYNQRLAFNAGGDNVVFECGGFAQFCPLNDRVKFLAKPVNVNEGGRVLAYLQR